MKFKYEDKQKFSSEVELYILEKGVSYIEAVLVVCEQQEIEPEVAAKLCTQPIIEKLEAEGRDFNMLPRGAKLPL